jgi:hypothetical protein
MAVYMLFPYASILTPCNGAPVAASVTLPFISLEKDVKGRREKTKKRTPFCPTGILPHEGAGSWRSTDHSLIFLDSIFIIHLIS